MTHSWLLFPWMCDTIPQIVPCILFNNCGPRCHLMWQFVTERPHPLYHICAKDQWWVLSLLLCVWTCQHSWHPKSTDLEQPSTSTFTITLPLAVCRVEYSSSIFWWWSWHVISSTFRCYCSARITILQPVMNFCSCHWSFLNTPAHCWTILTFTVVPPLTLSRCS